MIVQISEGFIKNKMNCERIYNKNTYQTIMALTKSNNTLSLAQQQVNEHCLFTWLTFNQDSARRNGTHNIYRARWKEQAIEYRCQSNTEEKLLLGSSVS